MAALGNSRRNPGSYSPSPAPLARTACVRNSRKTNPPGSGHVFTAGVYVSNIRRQRLGSDASVHRGPKARNIRGVRAPAFDKGDACDAIFHDGKIVSYTWIAFSPTHDSDGVFIEFRKGDRYGYKALTRPEYRGQHLRRRPQSDEYCHRRGCTHVIAFVDVINRSSLRSAAARGNVRIGYAGYLKRGRVFVPFRSRAVRRRGFRFFIPDPAPPLAGAQ